MGMSTHIQGFIPDTDTNYQRHKKVLLVCLEANVQLPKETAEYFGSNHAHESLLDEKLEVTLNEGEHYTQYSEESERGFEVDLTELPQGVTKLRFFNSW